MPALPGRPRAIKGARAAEMPQTGPKEETIYVNTEAGRRALEKSRAFIRRTILLAQSHGHSSFFPFIAETHAKMKSQKA